MGLNNPGIETVAKSVDFMLGKCHKNKLALGISVAESPGLTDWEKMVEDLLFSFRKAYKAADYIEINVSSPNTESVRIDWHKNFLRALLLEVMKIRKTLAPRKAVFVKLSPDMSKKSLDKTLDIVTEAEVTGLVLFNTFPAERMKLLNMKTKERRLPNVIKNGISGGISGRALYQNTLPAVKFIKKQSPGLHIFASGGIDHGTKVIELLEAGADAVQCFSVLSYRWYAIKKMNRETIAAMKQKKYKTLQYFDSFVTCE
jgi:dihydroorotate dehydrogenase